MSSPYAELVPTNPHPTLLRCFFNLSHHARKLIRALTERIDKDSLNERVELRFSTKELAAIADQPDQRPILRKTKLTEDELFLLEATAERIVNELFEHSYRFDWGSGIIAGHWIAGSSFSEDNGGSAVLTFDENATYVLHYFRALFELGLLLPVFELRSHYSPQLYVQACLAARSGGRGRIRWNADDVRLWLGVEEGSYARFMDLKRKVISVAVDEVNKAAPFTLTWQIEPENAQGHNPTVVFETRIGVAAGH